MYRSCFSSHRVTDAPRPGHRSVVMAATGMVATSQPLATLAGLDSLRQGGTAADAAVTAAAVQGVVEPFSTGIGGDCFLLYWASAARRLFAFNGSGRAPAAATINAYRERGHDRVPMLGALAVTVPGALDAWAALLDRFGTRSLGAALTPAIDHARHGFPVSEVIAQQWAMAGRLGALDAPEAARVFAPGGGAPAAGDVVRLPDLARTLSAVADGGARVLYEDKLAAQVSAAVAAGGGLLSASDLGAHRGEWVEPVTATYRGLTVAEAPPNSQGVAALIAVKLLEQFEIEGRDWDDPSLVHLRIEAAKLALVDRDRYIADPAAVHVPVGELLADGYVRTRAAAIDSRHASTTPAPGAPGGSDTVFIATADQEGNMCALINSLYFPFGSGIVVPDTGIALQNRGSSFSLEPAHPNALAPGKRPLHTIIPAMALVDGDAVLAFGIMGGNVQAQAHLQMISNVVDCGLNPQEALDAPRFHWFRGAEVACEASVPEATRRALTARGHALVPPATALVFGGFGGGQAIARDRDRGVYWGASDTRKDGCALGY